MTVVVGGDGLDKEPHAGEKKRRMRKRRMVGGGRRKEEEGRRGGREFQGRLNYFLEEQGSGKACVNEGK